MSDALIRQALETRLAAMSPAFATAWENVEFPAPAATVPFQTVSLLPAEPRNPETGTFSQMSGVFSIVQRFPPMTGPGAAQARAEAVRAHFPRNLTLTAGGLTVTVSRTPAIAGGFMDEGRYVVPVSVRYHADVST